MPHWDEAEVRAVGERLAELVAALPGLRTEDASGHIGYRVGGKRFAWLLVDHHGDERLALCVKAPVGEQQALVSADPERYFVPAYLGRHGWVGVQLDERSRPDWDDVASMLEQAWRLTAGRRAVAEYDAERGDGKPFA